MNERNWEQVFRSKGWIKRGKLVAPTGKIIYINWKSGGMEWFKADKESSDYDSQIYAASDGVLEIHKILNTDTMEKNIDFVGWGQINSVEIRNL